MWIVRGYNTLMNLDDLNGLYPTDKGRKKHGYLPTYERELGRLVGQGARLLELGVLKGQSLLLWRAWLGNAEVHGADINRFHPRLIRGIEGITYHVVDCSDREALGRMFAGQTWDVVIDDASHELDQQRVSYEVLWPQVRAGGLYVIEDVLPPTRDWFVENVSGTEVVDLTCGRKRRGDSVLLLFRK